jgi:GcrA cell cycle regulator
LTLISEYQKLVGAARAICESRPVGPPNWKTIMQCNWPQEHCEALREYHARGMSYLEIADAINRRFKTRYSRNAAIGRAKRMGLAVRSDDRNRTPSVPQGLQRALSGGSPEHAPAPLMRATIKLRCVGIQPRLIHLLELEPGDCRYPYGGEKDGEPIMFCAHPRVGGSSYCAAHLTLTRGPGAAPERPAGPVMLRLVAA